MPTQQRLPEVMERDAPSSSSGGLPARDIPLPEVESHLEDLAARNERAYAALQRAEQHIRSAVLLVRWSAARLQRSGFRRT